MLLLLLLLLLPAATVKRYERERAAVLYDTL
jgi:hypothetical protein